MTGVLDELLDLERAFWTRASGGLYADAMAPDGLMVFAPVGVLDKAQTIEAVEAAGPWTDVAVEEPRLVELAPDAAALVYRATGRRGGEAPYAALVTSVYVRRAGRWLLALHQQSALP